MPRKKIKDLPKTKRPRERLVNIGVSNLKDEELLAILIGSGSKKQNVIVLAKKLLRKYPLKKLAKTKLSDLTKIKGMGKVKAGKLVASFELGKRVFEKDLAKKIRSPLDVFYEVEDIKKKTREYLVAIFLNARHCLIEKKVITIGTLNANIVEPRDIFSFALKSPCAYIILVHNHPSGDPYPSEDDKRFTKKIQEAGEILGIEVLDHIIVTKNEYFSFKENDHWE